MYRNVSELAVNFNLTYNSGMEKLIEINGSTIALEFATDGRINKSSVRLLSGEGYKYCGKCQTAHPFDNFQIVSGKRRAYCIDCTRSAGRIEMNRRYHNRKNGIKGKRFVFRNLLTEYCGGKCGICGYDKFITALEYHHVKQKSFTILDKVQDVIATSNGIRTAHAQKLSDELSKCTLICANCHRAIHGKQISISPDRLDKLRLSVSAEVLIDIALKS